MDKSKIFAISNIGQPEKVRLLLYGNNQAAPFGHAPLLALMKAGFVLGEGQDWRQYADGSFVQWGDEGGGADVEVSFPRPFRQKCWHVLVRSHATVAADRLIVHQAANITLFSFTAVGRFVNFAGGGGVETTGFSWMAWGI